MPTESATYINTLDATRPGIDEPAGEGDDHLRLIKGALKATFPNVAGPITATHAELNGTIGVAARVTALENSRIVNNADQSLTGSLAISGSLNVAGVVKQAGTALVPAGMVIMWYGALNAIPSGYKLCDGTNGTPDLRDKFVVGASVASPFGTTLGANSLTVTTSSAGSHTHGGTQAAGSHTHGASTDTQGAHSHAGITGTVNLTIAQMPAHAHVTLLNNRLAGGGAGGRYLAGDPDGGDYQDTRVTSTVGGGDSHAHGIGLDGAHGHNVTVNSVGDHAHAIGTDGAHSHTGSWDNRPASVALVYVMKT